MNSLALHPPEPDRRKTRRGPATGKQGQPQLLRVERGHRMQGGRMQEVEAALRRWWDTPSLPNHPHPYPTLAELRRGQKKGGVARAEKSPESERTEPLRRKHRV